MDRSNLDNGEVYIKKIFFSLYHRKKIMEIERKKNKLQSKIEIKSINFCYEERILL